MFLDWEAKLRTMIVVKTPKYAVLRLDSSSISITMLTQKPYHSQVYFTIRAALIVFYDQHLLLRRHWHWMAACII